MTSLALRLLLAAVLLGGAACAPASYAYNFDITNPGAVNLSRPGERDVLEDADFRAEVLVDPTSFQAILLIVTNKTGQQLGVAWNQIGIVGPDRIEKRLHADQHDLGWIEPATTMRARLIPFELPSLGTAAASYEGLAFDLIVPLTVRGQPKDFRLHLVAHAIKL